MGHAPPSLMSWCCYPPQGYAFEGEAGDSRVPPDAPQPLLGSRHYRKVTLPETLRPLQKKPGSVSVEPTAASPPWGCYEVHDMKCSMTLAVIRCRSFGHFALPLSELFRSALSEGGSRASWNTVMEKDTSVWPYGHMGKHPSSLDGGIHRV